LSVTKRLAFLPIGDLFTMSPKEAAVACRLLRPKKLIPMHFGTFPPLTGHPDQLRERLAGAETEVWALDPGKPVECRTNCSSRSEQESTAKTAQPRRPSGMACMPNPAPRSTAEPPADKSGRMAAISDSPRATAASTPPAIHVYTGARCVL